MRHFAKGKSSAHAPISAALLAGGIAGSYSWLWVYPIDYVKTVMQFQDLGNLRYKNMWECTQHQCQIDGFRTFIKGLGITVLRSFPIHAVAFFLFESFMREMGWKKKWCSLFIDSIYLSSSHTLFQSKSQNILEKKLPKLFNFHCNWWQFEGMNVIIDIKWWSNHCFFSFFSLKMKKQSTM